MHLLRAERVADRVVEGRKRERLGDHVVDQQLEIGGALALKGIAGHQQDRQGRILARGR